MHCVQLQLPRWTSSWWWVMWIRTTTISNFQITTEKNDFRFQKDICSWLHAHIRKTVWFIVLPIPIVTWIEPFLLISFAVFTYLTIARRKRYMWRQNRKTAESYHMIDHQASQCLTCMIWSTCSTRKLLTHFTPTTAGVLHKKKSYARWFWGNPYRLHIYRKVMKCRIP